MSFAFKNKKTTKAAFKSKKRGKRSFRPSKTLAKVIQRIIHKDVETKVQSVNYALTAYNSGIDNSGDAQKTIPSIIQGTDNGQRVGDNIRGMSLTVRGHLLLAIPAVNNSTNCRIGVRLMCVQPRRYSNDVDVSAYSGSWMPQLLQNGANSVAFTGLIQDLYLPINRDAIHVYYDKVIYLNNPYQNQTTFTLIGSVIGTEDLVHSVKFFNMTIPMKNKLLRFQDGNNTPLNYSPMIILGYVHLDGSQADIGTTQVSMAYTSILKYEDA